MSGPRRPATHPAVLRRLGSNRFSAQRSMSDVFPTAAGSDRRVKAAIITSTRARVARTLVAQEKNLDEGVEVVLFFLLGLLARRSLPPRPGTVLFPFPLLPHVLLLRGELGLLGGLLLALRGSCRHAVRVEVVDDGQSLLRKAAAGAPLWRGLGLSPTRRGGRVGALTGAPGVRLARVEGLDAQRVLLPVLRILKAGHGAASPSRALAPVLSHDPLPAADARARLWSRGLGVQGVPAARMCDSD